MSVNIKRNANWTENMKFRLIQLLTTLIMLHNGEGKCTRKSNGEASYTGVCPSLQSRWNGWDHSKEIVFWLTLIVPNQLHNILVRVLQPVPNPFQIGLGMEPIVYLEQLGSTRINSISLLRLPRSVGFGEGESSYTSMIMYRAGCGLDVTADHAVVSYFEVGKGIFLCLFCSF